MSSAANFYQHKLAENRAALAPMAGFSDAPFRQLCRRYGSAWAVTEMVSAKALVMGEQQGIQIGAPYAGEKDLVIQVFGGEPDIVAAGGRILYERYKPRALDLNMGCPVKKVTGKSCGSKLMQDPERAAQIIRALNLAVPVPVSAKMRLGYDTVNATEVAAAVQEAGALLISVHGRTAAQKYSGEANWEEIAKVAQALRIPVVGSGDVASAAQVRRYQSWGLGVMIGRGALGKPWIFATLRGKTAPDALAIKQLMLEHARLALNWYRSEHAIVKLRGQLLRYADALPGAHDLKSKLQRVKTLQELQGVLEPPKSEAPAASPKLAEADLLTIR